MGILEGRIPSRALTYVLLMSAQSIKHYFHRVEEPHRSRIDLVLFVSDPTTPPCTRLLKLLQQAICRSKQTFIKDIPVVSVVTKMDKLPRPGNKLHHSANTTLNNPCLVPVIAKNVTVTVIANNPAFQNEATRITIITAFFKLKKFQITYANWTNGATYPWIRLLWNRVRN